MATNHRTLRTQIHEYNSRLDRILGARFGMSLLTYKVIKALNQLAGVVAGIYAMSLGADPLTSLAIIGGIYAGPEAVEAILMQGSDGSPTENTNSTD